MATPYIMPLGFIDRSTENRRDLHPHKPRGLIPPQRRHPRHRLALFPGAASDRKTPRLRLGRRLHHRHIQHHRTSTRSAVARRHSRDPQDRSCFPRLGKLIRARPGTQAHARAG